MTNTSNNSADKLSIASSVLVVPLILAFGLTGCAMADDEESVMIHAQAIGMPGLPDNGLPMPGLPDNGLPMPGLPDNGLPLPGLPDNGLASSTFVGEWDAWLNDPQRGESNAVLMSYIVRCALDSNQVSGYMDANGNTWVWPGEIGVAPGWAYGSISVSDRRWVTSCVLSLVNKNAQTVQISQRGSATSPYSDNAPELAIFTENEGGFFGDMFATTPVYYSCSAASDATLRTDGRVCTQADDSSDSLCQPIEALGTCEDICDVEIRTVNNTSYTVYTNCEAVDGTFYSQVTNTSLVPQVTDDDDNGED